MFVTKLDISWLDSPFLTHSRLIKDEGDISALLKAGVKKLVIDVNRGVVPDDNGPKIEPSEQKRVPEQANQAADHSSQEAAPKRAATPQKTPMKQEMGAAVALQGKIRKAVDRFITAFEREQSIDVEELTPLIEQTLSSLSRNDQALMSLVHLSRKSQKLADHSFGTFCLVLNLASARGIESDQREALAVAALLHEAGWAQLPLNLMGKRTRYTQTEKNLVEKHTVLGGKILSRSEIPKLALRLISEHHERLDGSGYPNGLKGEQIHPLSSIVSVVDAYEERVHQLTDLPGMVATTAIRSLFQDAEKGLFNPEVVAALINILGIYPVTSAVQLNTGEKGVVLEFHHDAPLQPTLKVVYDPQGKVYSAPLLIDLRQQDDSELKRSIECAIDLHSRQVDPLRRLELTEDDLL